MQLLNAELNKVLLDRDSMGMTFAGDSDLSSLLGGMSQEQLLRLIGGVGSLGGNTAAGLSNALRGAGRPSSTQSQDSTTQARVQSAPETQPSSSEEAATPQPRPVTAAALPGGPAVSSSDAARGGAQSIQLSDLQSVLSNIQGTLWHAYRGIHIALCYS